MANRFRLHVAFQPATGRVFCHASELTWTDDAPLATNIATLGLQLENYVPDPAGAETKADWTGRWVPVVGCCGASAKQLPLQHIG